MVRRRISKARFSAVSERPVSRQDGGVFDMARDEFEDAVRDALDEIPPELARVMDNVVVLVEDDAPPGEEDLLGLYEGVALTDRTDSWAAGSLPDRIFIYRNPTLAICDTREDVVEAVSYTHLTLPTILLV